MHIRLEFVSVIEENVHSHVITNACGGCLSMEELFRAFLMIPTHRPREREKELQGAVGLYRRPRGKG